MSSDSRMARHALSIPLILLMLAVSVPSASAFEPLCVEPDGRFTYEFKNGTPDMEGNTERDEVFAAMRMWEAVADVKFSPPSWPFSPDMRISWETNKEHGDGIPFTQAGHGFSAHGLYSCSPPSPSTYTADLHFNEAVTWSAEGSHWNMVKWVAAHELGHVIGLEDNDDETGLMWSDWYIDFSIPFGLSWDDILGAQYLYGLARGVFHLRDANSSGKPHNSFYYSDLGATPVTGDWNGDGIDTIGVFRSNHYWYLRDTNESLNATYVFHWGASGDRAVVGDWDGNGTDTVGVFRPSTNTFYLMNKNSGGVANHIFQFGNSEDIPVAGDWNEDGIDTIGVYRPSNSTFYLSNQLGGSPPVHYQASFGNTGDRPVVGDWNNSGTDTIGVYRPSTGFLYLRDTNTTGAADYSIEYGRTTLGPGAVATNGQPVSGDWDGNGTPTIGLFQN